MFWIGIKRPNHYPPDPGGDDGFRAGWCSAMSAARFKGYVERRAFEIVTTFLRVPKGFDLRVGPARPPMPAAADDLATLRQNGADHRIRRS